MLEPVQVPGAAKTDSSIWRDEVNAANVVLSPLELNPGKEQGNRSFRIASDVEI